MYVGVFAVEQYMSAAVAKQTLSSLGILYDRLSTAGSPRWL